MASIVIFYFRMKSTAYMINNGSDNHTLLWNVSTASITLTVPFCPRFFHYRTSEHESKVYLTTDLLRQLYLLPHWDASCGSNFLSQGILIQSQAILALPLQLPAYKRTATSFIITTTTTTIIIIIIIIVVVVTIIILSLSYYCHHHHYNHHHHHYYQYHWYDSAVQQSLGLPLSGRAHIFTLRPSRWYLSLRTIHRALTPTPQRVSEPCLKSDWDLR